MPEEACYAKKGQSGLLGSELLHSIENLRAWFLAAGKLTFIMTLQEKHTAMVEQFSKMRTGHDRLAAVVERGKSSPTFQAEQKTLDHKVQGCLSNLWFLPEYRDGLCYFKADSDSAVVKGVAALIAEFYSGHSPAEVVAYEPAFLKDIGITQHLSSNRRNGLTRIRQEMVNFAQKHLASTHA